MKPTQMNAYFFNGANGCFWEHCTMIEIITAYKCGDKPLYEFDCYLMGKEI